MAALTVGTASADTDASLNSDADVDEILVSGRRGSPLSAQQQDSLTRMEVVAIERAPVRRLDQMLEQTPGAGLFRRADSLTAHPTAQGLSMLPVGGNAAGRALVLLDGVPLNDPFGGWVNWSGIDVNQLESVAVLRGGGYGMLGSQAMTGALLLDSKSPVESGGSLQTSIGNRDSKAVSGSMDLRQERSYMVLAAQYFDTGGAYLLPAAQRGPIDVPAASDVLGLSLRGGVDISDTTGLNASVRWFEENRVNGLALAKNSTEGLDASLALQVRADTLSLDLTGFYQQRDFQNLFVAARDDRTSERPVLDQYDVPGRGWGLIGRLKLRLGDQAELETGADFQRRTGETNELYRNLGAGFTRARQAGGGQALAGLYATYSQQGGALQWSVNGRLNRWEIFDGIRQERDLAGGPLLRDDRAADRSGQVWTGAVSGRWQLRESLALTGSLYKSYRLPTINEFYRPFRIVNDITEANAALKPERLFGGEFGVLYQPKPGTELSLRYIQTWLKDGVGNVTVAEGPGFFPLGGFVPAGGTLRQRINVDSVTTRGVQASLLVEITPALTLQAEYLYAHARIGAFASMPDLIGNRPVQTPRHSASGSIAYVSDAGAWVTLQGRFTGGQYDDDTNTRWLDPALTLDAGAGYPVASGVLLRLDVENLLDATVIAALTASGLETLAKRRAIRLGLAVDF